MQAKLRSLPRRPSPATVLAVIALAVAASGTAIAAIPGGGGTISGCYAANGGSLRLIDRDAGDGCRRGETAISWKDGMTGKVANSDLLDGRDALDFLGANAKAADADRLDGIDSAALVQRVASGSFFVDHPTLAAGACRAGHYVNDGAIQDSDFALISNPFDEARHDGSTTTFAIEAYTDAGRLFMKMCNVGATAADPPAGTLLYRVLR